MSNNDLSDNNKSFKFGYDSVNDQYGYYKEEAGADTFVPFSILEPNVLKWVTGGDGTHTSTWSLSQGTYIIFAVAGSSYSYQSSASINITGSYSTIGTKSFNAQWNNVKTELRIITVESNSSVTVTTYSYNYSGYIHALIKLD